MNLDKEVRLEKQEGLVKKKNKERSKQDIFLHLLQLYEPNPKIISNNEVFHQIQDLYKLVSQHPKNRNMKSLKKIKAELSELLCFKSPPFNQQNPEFMQIFKRDNANIITLIASFVEITKYKKGAIVEATGIKRKSVKILLYGEIAHFQPVNYKSFKNCVKKLKDGEININFLNNSDVLLAEMLHIKKSENPEDFRQSQRLELKMGADANIADTKRTNVTEQNTAEFIEEAGAQLLNIGDVLTKSQCREILTKCNIISPLTPHKQSKKINIGDFVVDKDHPMFIDQKPQYYSCAVCCTDCIFLQIKYQIAKQVISLINSDRQRPFIQSLLFKFPTLKYFEAKQYVTQDFMITHQAEQEDGTKIVKKAIQIIKQLKVINSLNFQLSYTGEIYLIISGSVVLVIDQISQKKPSTLDEYIVSQKSVINREILHLFKNDIFGFQDIGKNRSANLRYLVTMGSKLLKINPYVLKIHKQTLPGFKEQINNMVNDRNSIISDILKKIEQNLEIQEIQRHGSITYSKSELKLAQLRPSKSIQLTKNEKPICQLKYLGHQDFSSASNKIRQHFSPLREDIPKQSLSPEIVKQHGLGIQFSKNLLKKPNERIQIKNGWIEIRNSKGKLLRRKRVKQSEISEVGEGQSDALLRKLGILTSKQIADHNFEMVTKRASKYQFEDLHKQANEFKAIRQKSESLPKLTKFFAKKQDRLFTILYKRTHL